MRHTLIRFLSLLDVDAAWYALNPSPSVFRITKNNHNILRGVADANPRPTQENKDAFDAWTLKNGLRWTADGGPLAPGGVDAEILFLRGMGPIPTCPPPSSSDASSPSCLTPINGLDTGAHPGPKLPSGATLPPPSLPGPSTAQDEDADADADLTLDEIFPPELQPPEDDPSSYLTTARRQARLKVYDLDYLMKERMWGPWEVIPKYVEEVKERQRKREHRSRIYAERMREVSDRAGALNGVATDEGATEGAMERDDVDEDDVDAYDGDWMPDVLAYGEGELYEELVLNDDDEDFHYEEIDEDDEDDAGIPHASDVFVLAEEDDDEPVGSGMSSPLSTGSGPPTVNGNNHNNPNGAPSHNLTQGDVEEHQHLLVPDYTFLAAARLIIETNLREHYHAVSAFHGVLVVLE